MKQGAGDLGGGRELGRFPGEIAGASLKLEQGAHARPANDAIPRRNRRGLIEARSRRLRDWTSRRFPGEIAGASLKPHDRDVNAAINIDSPAKSPGPH